MKKILTLIVAIAIIASISVSSFAAVTMSPYVFRSTEDDGNTYIYHFGTRDNTEEEVGIKINGKTYKAESFDTATNTKFGIGIADPSGKLEDTYTVTPYAGENEYTPVVVDKNASENVVINVADNGLYNAEPAFTVNSCYTARTAYDEFEAFFTEYANSNSSNYSMMITYNLATGNDYGYAVPFIQFSMPDNLSMITSGRKLYLDVTVFGDSNVTEDYYLDLYGVKEEGIYSSDNLPEADETNGIIDSATLPVEKFTTNTATDRIRVRFDVTNYVKKRAYEGLDTVTFAFKTRGIKYNNEEAENVNTVIYTGNKTTNDTAIAFEPMSSVVYAPALIYGGEFNVDTPDGGYPKAQIKVTDYAARQQSNTDYRTPAVTNTVQLISAKTNVDYSVQTGYMQLTLPETFKGIEKGTKIELNFYAYTYKYNNATTGIGDVNVYAFGTANEYTAANRPTTNSTDWTTDYPIRDRNNVLGSFTVSGSATNSAPQLCTLDITDYVLQKMANGEDTATISFKVEYQDTSAATDLLWAQIYAHDTSTVFAPYVQYRQGNDTFLSDGSDVDWNISAQSASVVSRKTNIWSSTDGKRLSITSSINEDENILNYVAIGTGIATSDGTMYNSYQNTSFDNWIVQGYTMSFDLTTIIDAGTITGQIPTDKKVYLNFKYTPQYKTGHTISVISLSGGTKSVSLAAYDGSTKTEDLSYSVYSNATKIAESSATGTDTSAVEDVKIDITDAVNGMIASSTKQLVIAVHPTLTGGTAELRSQAQGKLILNSTTGVCPYITVE